ncbi:MAG TPA: tetratricopeptide repeat protein, partial [Methylomirabilota bacterium]|nr:tetratricopeptide repeat protein [Methylomirabilota bacterium]
MSFAVALVIFLLSPAWVMAQTPDWESVMGAAQRAEEGGRLGDAEQLYAVAIAKTQGFDEKDLRIEQSLTALGELYGAQGRYADAARFYDRALTALEKALPAGDPGLVPGLNRLGVMWR